MEGQTIWNVPLHCLRKNVVQIFLKNEQAEVRNQSENRFYCHKHTA